jgi:site-specific recombinase XerD
VTQLKCAAEQLIHLNTRKNQQPVRDCAILLILLHTAVRVSEMVALDLKQYKGEYLRNIKRKGKKVSETEAVTVAHEADTIGAMPF